MIGLFNNNKNTNSDNYKISNNHLKIFYIIYNNIFIMKSKNMVKILNSGIANIISNIWGLIILYILYV